MKALHGSTILELNNHDRAKIYALEPEKIRANLQALIQKQQVKLSNAINNFAPTAVNHPYTNQEQEQLQNSLIWYMRESLFNDFNIELKNKVILEMGCGADAYKTLQLLVWPQSNNNNIPLYHTIKNFLGIDAILDPDQTKKTLEEIMQKTYPSLSYLPPVQAAQIWQTLTDAKHAIQEGKLFQCKTIEQFAESFINSSTNTITPDILFAIGFDPNYFKVTNNTNPDQIKANVCSGFKTYLWDTENKIGQATIRESLQAIKTINAKDVILYITLLKDADRINTFQALGGPLLEEFFALNYEGHTMKTVTADVFGQTTHLGITIHAHNPIGRKVFMNVNEYCESEHCIKLMEQTKAAREKMEMQLKNNPTISQHLAEKAQQNNLNSSTLPNIKNLTLVSPHNHARKPSVDNDTKEIAK